MASSSKSRKTNLSETDILPFIDNVSNSEKNLYTNDDDDDHDDDDENSSDSDLDYEISNNDEVRAIPNINSNRNMSVIEVVVDESNYNPSPPSGEQTFISNFCEKEITWTKSKPNVQ